MKIRTVKLASLLDSGTRRRLWDLRDQLEAQEKIGLRRQFESARPVRFHRNGVRILGVIHHAYAS